MLELQCINEWFSRFWCEVKQKGWNPPNLPPPVSIFLTKHKSHSNFGEDSAKLSEISEKFSEIPVSLSEISKS